MQIGLKQSAFASIAAVATVYLLTMVAIEARGFWTTDNANKYLQLRALIASDYLDASLPWPGRRVDPDLMLNPLPAPFSHVENGRLHSQYPPFFAAVSSLPYRVLGFPGLYLLPLLASVLALGGVARLAGTLGLGIGGRHAAVLLAGLCTPLWFYAVVFWEHAPAICLCVWATHFMLRFFRERSYRLLAASMALATFAVYFREELILFCGILVVLIGLEARREAAKAVSFAVLLLLAVLLPSLWMQWKWTGSPLGYHVSSNLVSLSDHLTSRPTVLYRMLLAAGPSTALSIALTAPFVVGLIWSPRIDSSRFRAALPVAAAFATVVGLVVMLGFRDGPIHHLLKSNSLFPASPILLSGLIRLDDGEDDGENDSGLARHVRILILLFAVGYAAAAPTVSSQGIHWGNRFLLLLYPLLTVLAARNLTEWFAAPSLRSRWGAVAIASTILVSLTAQLYSIRLLGTKKEFSRHLNDVVAQHSEPAVVTDLWWVPQELFSTFYERPVFLVRSPPQWRVLRRGLRAEGSTDFLFVTGARNAPPSATLIDDGGLGIYSLAVTSQSIRARPRR